MTSNRIVTKQVKFNGSLIPATYEARKDGSFAVDLKYGRRKAHIEIVWEEPQGRSRAGYQARVGRWESRHQRTPQRALRSACKMLRSNA